MHTSPTPLHVEFTPEESAAQVLIHVNNAIEQRQHALAKMRGAHNPKWGKGPTLQEQKDFLNGFNREEYAEKYQR